MTFDIQRKIKSLKDADKLWLEWQIRTAQDYYGEWEIELYRILTLEGFEDSEVWDFIDHPENYLDDINWRGGSPNSDPKFKDCSWR